MTTNVSNQHYNASITLLDDNQIEKRFRGLEGAPIHLFTVDELKYLKREILLVC